MISPRAPWIWQHAADAGFPARLGFAKPRPSAQHEDVQRDAATRGAARSIPTPSLSSRSDLSVRPHLFSVCGAADPQAVADARVFARQPAALGFKSSAIALDSSGTEQSLGGRTPCVNPRSFLQSSLRPLCRVAWRPTANARLAVRLPVRSSRMRPTPTCLPVRQSVLWPAPIATTRASATKAQAASFSLIGARARAAGRPSDHAIGALPPRWHFVLPIEPPITKSGAGFAPSCPMGRD